MTSLVSFQSEREGVSCRRCRSPLSLCERRDTLTRGRARRPRLALTDLTYPVGPSHPLLLPSLRPRSQLASSRCPTTMVLTSTLSSRTSEAASPTPRRSPSRSPTVRLRATKSCKYPHSQPKVCFPPLSGPLTKLAFPASPSHLLQLLLVVVQPVRSESGGCGVMRNFLTCTILDSP